MATYIFQKISKEGKASGVQPSTEDARDWYRDRAMQTKNVNVQKEIKNKARLQNKMTQMDIGRMYHFFYDPKYKDKLPYYDRFPLIFVMEKYKDGFLGLNMHYLPLVYRARLMDQLYTIEKNDALRQAKKLKMSYALLNSAKKFKYFRPAVKRYLNNHIKSRFLAVPYEEWDIALFLPTERFRKAKKQKVWAESKKQIMGR